MVEPLRAPEMCPPLRHGVPLMTMVPSRTEPDCCQVIVNVPAAGSVVSFHVPDQVPDRPALWFGGVVVAPVTPVTPVTVGGLVATVGPVGPVAACSLPVAPLVVPPPPHAVPRTATNARATPRVDRRRIPGIRPPASWTPAFSIPQSAVSRGGQGRGPGVTAPWRSTGSPARACGPAGIYEAEYPSGRSVCTEWSVCS